MKKIILGSILTIINFSAWSACSYIFDATEQDLRDTNEFPASFTVFPTTSDKLSFKTELSLSKSYVALSKTTLNRMEINRNESWLIDGDKNLPSNGIIAYELKIKVPEIINPESGLRMFPSLIGTRMENGDIFGISPDYMREGQRNEFLIDAVIRGKNDQSFDGISFKPQKNTDGYQNIGVYMNQNTQQIGIISNGVNHGYIYTYPSKLKNIYFLFMATHGNIISSDINKEFSIELVTEATKLKNDYPTGTTDICGTKI